MESITKKNEMLHICYAVHDKKGNFSKFVGTSLCSIFENTKAWITIHLLHDDTLTEENKEHFIFLARSYGQMICFYNMTSWLAQTGIEKKLPQALSSRFSPAALYRLFLSQLLPAPIRKILYLDADIIVNFDIQELWCESTGEYGVAAIAEKALTHNRMVPKFLCHSGMVAEDRYFNSGVLLLDFDLLEQPSDFVEQGLAMLQKYPECNCYDQDILNYFYADKYRQLPLRYNVFVIVERIENQPVKNCLYHYAGKALDLVQRNPFGDLFLSYFMKTPWCTTEFLAGIFSSALPKKVDQQKLRMRQLLLAARQRNLVFCGSGREETAIRTLFHAEEAQYLIVDDELQRWRIDWVLREMKKNRTPSCYLVFIPDYEKVSLSLRQQGYVENIDYMNGFELLSCAEGGGKDRLYQAFSEL